jgi:hypothetical protein
MVEKHRQNVNDGSEGSWFHCDPEVFHSGGMKKDRRRDLTSQAAGLKYRQFPAKFPGTTRTEKSSNRIYDSNLVVATSREEQ